MLNFLGKYDLVILFGDDEFSPGPRSNSSHHWNLSSIATLNFSKIPLLKVHNAIHTYDIICLAKTYISHDILIDDDNLSMMGYELIKVGPTIKSKLFKSYLKECLILNLSVNGKQCNITLIYCLPSQSSVEFYTLLTNFELSSENILNRNPFVSIIINNFVVLVIKQFMNVKNVNS